MIGRKYINNISTSLISSIIRYFSVIIKLLFVLTIISCYFYTTSSIEELKTQEINQVKSASNLLYRNIYSNINYAKYQIYYVAKQLSQTGGDKKKINQILSSYKTNINNDFDVVTTWNMYSWIDEKGNLSVDGFEGILKRPINMNHRDYLPITKQNPGKVIFGKVVKGAVSGRSIVPIGVGVLDNNGSYIGTIVFGIDIEKLTAKLENSVRENLSQFFLVNDSKSVIFKSSSLYDKQIDQVISKINLNEDKVYSLEDSLFAKVSVISDFADNSSNYYLITINDDNVFSSKVDNLVIQKLFTCLMLLLFIALLMSRLYYKVVRPVRVLSQYADGITKHKHSNIVLSEDLGSKEFQNLYSKLSLIEAHLEKEQLFKQKLGEINTNLQALTKSINHDLRNYISGISGLARIIFEESDNSKSQSRNKEYAKVIIDQSDEILSFVEDLLDKNLEDVNTVKMHPENRFSIKDLLKEIIFLSQKFIKQQDVRVILEIEDEIPDIDGDKVNIRRVLDNLITNSVKYSPKGSKVLISAQYLPKSQEVYIEIVDNGIGMSEDEIKMALTGKGAEVDKSGLGKAIDSHGIGLPLVKKIIDSLKAKMEIESKKYQGTKFRLWFSVGSAKK